MSFGETTFELAARSDASRSLFGQTRRYRGPTARIPERTQPDLIVVRLTQAEPVDEIEGYLVVKPSP